MLYRKRFSRLALLLFVFVPIALFILISYIEEQHIASPLPSPARGSELYPYKLPLFDLPDFQYIINNDVCGNQKVLGVILVHSHPANKDRRAAMRLGIPKEDLEDLGLRRVFLLARAEWNDQDLYKKTPQEEITKENEVHGDIVQGNFKEHYHNLTLKHTMGLQWASLSCPRASYVIKMDDDIILDVYQFRNRLKYRYDGRQNLILGLLQIEAKVIRDPTSKWYVPRAELSVDHYPNFVSGWTYAATMDAVRKIVAATRTAPFFWIDDAYITGIIAEKCGIKREGWNSLYTIYSEHLKCCVQQDGYKNYYCDFYVGPSEGDVNLMKKLLQHARSCYISSCQKRKEDARIEKTCVVVDSDKNQPSGTGRGEVIKVFK